jgi:hypothetical protein
LDRPSYKELQFEDGIKVAITARTKREAHKMLEGAKRKYPNTNISEVLDNISVDTSYLKSAVKLDILFGGEIAGRSLVKTAIAFAHRSGISVDNCDVARNYLRDPVAVAPFGYFYQEDLVEGRPTGVPIHCVAISGNPKTGMLLGYVEYFSVLRIVVCLSDKYEGIQIDRAFAIDPATATEIHPSVRLAFSASDIGAIYDYRKIPDGALQRVFTEVVPTGLKRNFQAERNRVIHEAVEYAFANCGAKRDETLTPEQINRLSGLVIEKMMPFIMRNVRRPHR